MRKNDLTNQTFGRLTAFYERGRNRWGNVLWLCVCSCGGIKIVPAGRLKSGTTKSCGCLSPELSAIRGRKLLTTHGQSKTPLYAVWQAMKARCYNQSCASYGNYGGRGITICKEWNNFETFANWALNSGYSPDLTIDRIDNDSGYSPENCRWVSMAVQASNRRNNRRITFNSESLTVTQWGRKLGGSDSLIWNRLRRGWPPDRLIISQIEC